jgi:Zn-dependent protease/CBS domain-containing protein
VNSTLRLGRVAGVEIGLHWSWLLVVGLVVWSLSQGVFPETNPGLSDTAYLVMGGVAAVGFFASILLHELGHAVQARRDGVAIEGITLWVFGGVAQLRGQVPSAGAELRIAAAGPAVSLVLGVVCVAAALFLPLPAGVDGVLFWLGQMNLILLVFNLIPALPLDGGRILRALLWRRRRDFVSATRTAGRLGRGFGQLFIAGGLAQLFFLNDYGGLWTAFIGWFVLAAAESELESASARVALAGLWVPDVMVPDPMTVPAAASVEAFFDGPFMATRHTAYPVLEAGLPVGLVSFRDALKLPRDDWPVTPVREVMADGPEVWIDAETPLADAFGRLAAGERGRLLVHRHGRLAGLLSMTDVSRVLEVQSRSVSARRPAATAPERPVPRPLSADRGRTPAARP